MHGAQVADKVVGKAAAALMVLGGVREVYTDIISEPALAVLHKANIRVECVQIVSRIWNRNRTGWCPLETLCYELESPEAMYPYKPPGHPPAPSMRQLLFLPPCQQPALHAKRPDAEKSLKIPIVNTERCIGCGACENLCPSSPFSTIYVEGHEMHRII